MYRKSLKLLLIALHTFFLHSSLQAQDAGYKASEATISYQVLTPAKLETTTPLKNPGIGIEQASQLENRAGKTAPTYPGTVGPRNNSLDGVAAIRYIRSDWVSLAPAKNEYHWATLEANINHAWTNGQQIGFSINTASPVLGGSGNYWQNVPAWFMNDPRHVQCTAPNFPEGCTYYKVNFTNCSSMGTGADCTDNWAVNHDDPVFIQEQLKLIDTLRKRYDNPEWAVKWAYLDMRNWGVWGEWQTDEARITGTSTAWPHPSLENKKAIIDAFLKFEYIPVIANYHDEVSWVYACEQGAAKQKMVGWRTDGIDVTAWKINPAISTYPAIRDAWKTGPIYGEIMGSNIANDLLTDNVLPRAYLWNMSGFNNKYDNKYSSDATYRGLIDEFRAKGGYRLAIDELRIPLVVPKGEGFTLTAKISNSGTSPIYRKFYQLSLKLSPVGGGADMIIPLTGTLHTILPGATGTFTAQYTANLEVGDYTISVGITGDPLFTTPPPPVSLANTTNVATGPVHWNSIGIMNVTYPVSAGGVEINPKDFVASGNTKIYTVYGSLIRVFPAGFNVSTWMNNADIPSGIYLVNHGRKSSLRFISRR
jgi:hypothetical protein